MVNYLTSVARNSRCVLPFHRELLSMNDALCSNVNLNGWLSVGHPSYINKMMTELVGFTMPRI